MENLKAVKKGASNKYEVRFLKYNESRTHFKG